MCENEFCKVSTPQTIYALRWATYLLYQFPSIYVLESIFSSIFLSKFTAVTKRALYYLVFAAQFDVPEGIKVKVVQVTTGTRGYITVHVCVLQGI